MPEDHVDQETLRLLAVYKKRPIHVYDNLYAIKEGWKFKGEPKSPATIRKQKQEGIYHSTQPCAQNMICPTVNRNP